MTSVDPRATLVVTRPERDARPLVDALRSRGRSVIALPVIAIEEVADPSTLARTMQRIGDYRLVVFVSPNAIRQALAHRDGWPHDVVVGVMGPGSVAALKSLGIAAPAYRVVSPTPSASAGSDHDRFDSEALFDALDALLDLHGLDGPVLILRGNGGRAWFAERLRGLGIVVDEVEAYRRVRPTADATASQALRRLFAARDRTTFVVTSSEGIANLVTIVVEAIANDRVADDVRSWLFGGLVIAPHRRIAETARTAGFERVLVCAPGDEGILAAIE